MDNTDELNLIELFNIFWSKKWFIILALIIGCVAGHIYNQLTFIPQYSSYTTMILSKPLTTTNEINSNTNNEFSITYEDISLNKNLISTYRELIKSKLVTNTVIENLDLNISASSISSMLNVKQVLDSEIIMVTVTSTEPTLSMEIANEIAKVFSDIVKDKYNIQNVSVIDVAEISDEIVNDKRTQNIILFAAIGFILSAVVVFLISYFDTTIKTEEDITKITNLPILAIVPKYANEKGGRNKNDRR